MKENYNTDLNNYTSEELLDILDLNNNYTKEEVLNKILNLSQTLFFNNENMKTFLNNIQDRLIDEINFNYNEKILSDYKTNIEIEKNQEYDEENQNDEYDEDDQDHEDDEDDKEENKITNNSKLENYNDYELIKKNKNEIENYNIYNYLHFDTKFRSKNNLEIETSPGDSTFILSNPIINISRIKLSSINIKKPFLISNIKSNNKFIIKEFNSQNNCIREHDILIDDGYYDDPQLLEDFLNTKHFNSSSDQDFLKNLTFSIDKNSNKICFDLSSSYNDAGYSYFSLDFKTNYIPNYSLATILGFKYSKNSNYYKSTSNKIISPYNYSNKGTSELFFCFDEYQSNIIETHKLFFDSNMSTQKILAKINCAKANINTNHYISEIYSTNETRNDHSRFYDGLINLLNFKIKIIDNYGNILINNINEDFTFTLEVKIDNIRLIK
tara:strand:- start:2785 stop:4104 length:1320 start_codon:yes stop_codon:yes gene_type:complete